MHMIVEFTEFVLGKNNIKITIYASKILTLHFKSKKLYMKKIILSALLLVGASTFTMAQTPAEQVMEKVKALIKNGGTDISKILPQQESDDKKYLDDDDDTDIDQLAGKSEDYIRGYNDSRRAAYAEQKEAFIKAGVDLSQTTIGNFKQDSVGIYAHIGGNLVPMKYIEVKEIERTGYFNPFKDKELSLFGGKTSPYQFTGTAHFRIYFTHDRNSISEYYDMFSSDYTIDDFFVVKFKNVSKGRQMTSAVFHSNRIKGAKYDSSVKVNVEKINDNIYDVTVEGAPGEYCLTYNINKSGTYEGNKGGGSRSVFDFTIK